MKNLMDAFDFSRFGNETRIRKEDVFVLHGSPIQPPDIIKRREWIKNQLQSGVDFFHVRADGRSLMHLFIEFGISWIIRDVFEVMGQGERYEHLKRGGRRGHSFLMTALQNGQTGAFDALRRIEDEAPGTLMLDNETVHYRNLVHYIVGTPIAKFANNRIHWVLNRTPPSYINRHAIYSVKHPDVYTATPMIAAAWQGDADLIRLLVEHGGDLGLYMDTPPDPALGRVMWSPVQENYVGLSDLSGYDILELRGLQDIFAEPDPEEAEATEGVVNNAFTAAQALKNAGLRASTITEDEDGIIHIRGLRKEAEASEA